MSEYHMASLPHPAPSGTMSLNSAVPCERQVLREYFVVIGRALLAFPAPQDVVVEALLNRRVGNQVSIVRKQSFPARRGSQISVPLCLTHLPVAASIRKALVRIVSSSGGLFNCHLLNREGSDGSLPTGSLTLVLRKNF